MPMVFSQGGRALNFSFSVEGEVQVKTAILGLLRNVQDLTPIWGSVEEILRESIRNRFSVEGKPAWPELKPSTVQQRIREGFPGEHPILIRTGWLMDSMILRSHPQHIYNKGRLFMEMGTTVPYGIYHQSPAPRHKLSRRPFIFIDKMDLTKIISKIRKHLINIGAASEHPGRH